MSPRQHERGIHALRLGADGASGAGSAAADASQRQPPSPLMIRAKLGGSLGSRDGHEFTHVGADSDGLDIAELLSPDGL